MADGHGRFDDDARDDSRERKLQKRNKTPKTSFAPIAAPGKINAFTRPDDVLRDKTLVYEDMVRIFVASKVPIFLWGSFGAGKTRAVESLANETDEAGTPYQVITIQPSKDDPTVIHGLMTVIHDAKAQREVTIRSIPEPAKSVLDYFENRDGLTIMFLDEMTTCSNAQQNALLGLLTHGQYGDDDISPYVTFVCAANPPSTVSTVQDLGEQVINRGGHIPWYTNGDEWLKKWKTGFGSVSKVPDRDTIAFAETLLSFDKDVSFRADPDHFEDEEDMWDIDHLCPYDQMDLTARSVTEALKVFVIIKNTFKDSSYEIRKLYVEEAMKAMLGPRWSKNAARAFDLLEQAAGTRPAMEAVRKFGIRPHITHSELVDILGDSLHRNQGKIMRADQEHDLAERFYEEIFEDDNLSLTAYYAFFAWLATSTQESTRKPVIPIAVKIINRTVSEFVNNIPKGDIIPEFLPSEIYDEIRTAFSFVLHQK